MRVMLVTAAMAMAVPAAAQQAAPAAAPQTASSEQAVLSDMMCKLAGECLPSANGDTPTIAAPATKGFSIANGARGIAAAPARTAKPSRFVRTTTAEPSHGRTPRLGRVAASRYTAPVANPVAGTGVAAPGRANLLLAFAYNSAQLTPGAEARARIFAKALAMPQLADKRFVIEGHTDARGSRALNMDLSRRRAQAVVDFLVAQGVDRTRVQVSGVGPDRPLPGLSAKAEANRRVEAVVVS